MPPSFITARFRRALARLRRFPGHPARSVALLLFSWFLLHCTVVTWDGLRDEASPADVAIVFGNTVRTDGTPSPRLKARLDCALHLYRQGTVRHILVSGGLGKEGFDEAVVMRDYLLSSGVPAQALLTDSDGYTTLRTARNAARLLSDHGLHSAVAVSQFHHIPRARLALRRVGIHPVTGAHARHFEPRDLYALFREFFAFYKYLLLAR